MRKFIVAVLILTGLSATAFAQSQKGKVQSLQSTNPQQVAVETSAKAETDKWAQALTLTPAQKTQIHQVNIQVAITKEQIKQAGASASPERTTYLMKNKNSRYKNILTAEQYAKYEKMINGTNIGSTNNMTTN